jgi:hypothetical protein
VYDAISIEERGKPVAVVCNRGFVTDARSAAASRGWPGVRAVAETVSSESTDAGEISNGIDAAIDDIVAAMTAPLTDEEKSPKPGQVEKSSRIAFSGDLEEVNRFFYRRGWSDGLPIIPPTEAAVAEMLTGTDLPPDHVVAKIIPRLGKATVEKIAVNAVMAGCLPTYMPVLIAGVKALMDPRAFFGTHEVSTASFAPCWIINGPIRGQLHVNSGSGAFSPGDIANATIGRAIGLIVKNIGGARKGVEDMGTFGNPGKYTMVIAENEEESPWEPLHVEHGFSKEDSTVTVFFPYTFVQRLAYGSEDKDILNTLVYNCVSGKMYCFLLLPHQAKVLAGRGWSKRDIVRYVAEYARVPAYKHSLYVGVLGSAVRGKIPSDPNAPMAQLRDPAFVRVVVAGGAGNQTAMLGGIGLGDPDWVTVKVELPADWDKLVKKYANLVPSYLRY